MPDDSIWSIPAGIRPPPAPANPLDVVSNLANVQNALNQNQLFQQQMAARRVAGQIFSSSKNAEEAMTRISQSPYAPYLGDMLTQYRSIQQMLVATTGEKQNQAIQGRNFVLSALGPAYNDPSKFEQLLDTTSKALPQVTQDANAPYLADLKRTLGPLAKSDPVAYRRGIIGAMLSAGVSPDAIRMAGGDIPAPTMARAPSGAEYTVGGLRPEAGPQPGEATSMPPAPGAAPSSPVLSIGGKPVSLSDVTGAPRTAGAAGIPILSESEQASATQMLGQYQEEHKEYQGAVRALGSVEQMSSTYDRLAKQGLLTPGAFGQARLELAKAVTAAEQIAGRKLDFDPQDIQSAENLISESRKLSLNVMTQSLGAGREAAGTIDRITEAVPGIENTVMGGRLIIEGIKEASQRLIDKRRFQNAWLANPRNGGDLTGSDVKFDEMFPAEDYAQRVLHKFGLTSKGFATREAAGKAFEQGYITEDQLRGILKKQFKMGEEGNAR